MVQEVIIQQEQSGPDAPPPADGRPENVPEQFWDAEKKAVNTEALLASYAELAAAGKDDGEEAQEGTDGGDDNAAEALADEAGIDVAAVEEHFLEHGDIPEDTYERAAKIGITREMVDEFVQYRVSQADRVREEILQPYGGEEAVTRMVDWAAKNWAAEQAGAFNDAVNSGERGRMELALRGLKADYDKANGVRPGLVKGTTGRTPGGDRFESLAQLVAAQNDPRYRTDPAYRDAVIAKLARSNI